jgi:hypothetical protein
VAIVAVFTVEKRILVLKSGNVFCWRSGVTRGVLLHGRAMSFPSLKDGPLEQCSSRAALRTDSLQSTSIPLWVSVRTHKGSWSYVRLLILLFCGQCQGLCSVLSVVGAVSKW